MALSVKPVELVIPAGVVAGPDPSLSYEVIAAQSHVGFWSRQIQEHALFLHLGLQDDGTNGIKSLKKEAEKLYKQWDTFRTKHAETDFVALSKLIDAQGELQREVIAKQKAGMWVGWLFPDFLDHIHRELNYFVAQARNEVISIQDQVSFWNHINQDHAEFEAHLLDPTEVTNIHMAMSIAGDFKNIKATEINQFIMLSLAATEKLGGFQFEARSLAKQNKLSSVIHPLLTDHVIRENQRSIFALNQLASESRPASPRPRSPRSIYQTTNGPVEWATTGVLDYTPTGQPITYSGFKSV